jgi:hypothetical protein
MTQPAGKSVLFPMQELGRSHDLGLPLGRDIRSWGEGTRDIGPGDAHEVGNIGRVDMPHTLPRVVGHLRPFGTMPSSTSASRT